MRSRDVQLCRGREIRVVSCSADGGVQYSTRRLNMERYACSTSSTLWCAHTSAKVAGGWRGVPCTWRKECRPPTPRWCRGLGYGRHWDLAVEKFLLLDGVGSDC